MTWDDGVQKPKRIGLLEHFGTGNLGDDATVAAVLQQIRRRWPDVSITGLSLDPSDSEARHGIPCYPIRQGNLSFSTEPHEPATNSGTVFKDKLRALLGEYRRWHGVARYASQLGCSEKTLNRATRAVADLSAKALLVGRIVLEAKRLLAHSAAPVAAIAADLGFEEATNFVKFFRRETGLTPGAFRARNG